MWKMNGQRVAWRQGMRDVFIGECRQKFVWEKN